MDRLQAMETFTLVVETGGFKRAAERLRVLPSTVTKTIKDLEAHLGVQLLNRTTRAISVTDAGLRYYDSCKAILREIQAAEEDVAGRSGMIRGAIRVGTTPSLARHVIIPALPQFAARYPGIYIDLHLSDAVVDLVHKGIDCVIRAGEPRLSNLIVRRLALFPWYVCGSPDYLQRYGEPASIADLQRHLAVGYADSRTSRTTNWTFREADQVISLSLKDCLTVDDTDAYIAAGLAGLGLIRAASYVVREHLSQGRLVRLLTHLEPSTDPLSVLYPQSRHLSPAVRAFIDWCVEVIGQEARSW
jgi:DNA-binding transcriptional LysR family regulator